MYEQAIAIEKGKEHSQTLPMLFAQYSRFAYLVWWTAWWMNSVVLINYIICSIILFTSLWALWLPYVSNFHIHVAFLYVFATLEIKLYKQLKFLHAHAQKYIHLSINLRSDY